MKFYGRNKEIGTLKSLKKDFRIAILGRRRIGKTTLVEHFYKQKCLTFFIPAEKAEKEIISSWVDEYSSLYLPRVSTFKEFFEFIFVHFKDKVIFMDEVQNVLKVNKSFVFDLQRLIDKHKPKLVVSGSLISTMKNIVEEYKSPLYGRFDLILKLGELDFPTIYKIGNDIKLNMEEIFQLYSVFGGIPKYYELIKKLKPFRFEKFILDVFVKYPRPLYEEVRTMLKEEFGKEYKTFFSIISSISQGKNKHSEISAFLGKKETEITKYLSMLKNDFEVIERNVPVVGGKKGVYSIKNNLFSFWFNYVWRYNNLIEIGEEDKAAEIVEKNANTHVSLLFEKIILELIKTEVISLPKFDKLGKQWGKIAQAAKDKNQYEIDICGINEKTKEILFCECKWQEKVNADNIFAELKEKAKYVQWHNNERKEYYAIFAKSFKTKTFSEGKNLKDVFLFDLEDLERLLG